MAAEEQGAKTSVEESKSKSRRGYSSIKAIDPRDGGHWDLLLSDDKMRWTASRGEGAARELAFTVRESLLNIRALFRGVRDIDREIDEDDWLCYVATPAYGYNYKTNERVEAWPGEVFLTYVTNERVIYNWYWAKCDPADPKLPYDYQNRFHERVF